MYRIKKLLSNAFLIVGLIQLLCITLSMSGGAGRQMDPQLQEEYCKNFTYGNGRTEFFSPGFPRNYPAGIKCSRTIRYSYLNAELYCTFFLN